MISCQNKNTDIQKFILSMIKEISEVDEVSLEMKLSELNIESLDFLRIIAGIEEHY